MGTSSAPIKKPSLTSQIGSYAALIDRGLSAGDIAMLRRLRADEVYSAVFWRLMTLQENILPPQGPSRDEAERRWACILQAMAVLRGLHRPSEPLGRVLASKGLAEQRFIRLLRASDSALSECVRVTAHYLAHKGAGVNQADLASLVLSEGNSNSESTRRRIARSYYGQQTKEAKA